MNNNNNGLRKIVVDSVLYAGKKYNFDRAFIVTLQRLPKPVESAYVMSARAVSVRSIAFYGTNRVQGVRIAVFGYNHRTSTMTRARRKTFSKASRKLFEN